MWKITIKGNKKSVLLAWSSAVGYGNPDILDEGGTNEEYYMECEISTKYDVSPYGEELFVDPGEWDGSVLNLEVYDEQKIRNCEYEEFLNIDPFKISGLLNVDLLMKHVPDNLDELMEMEEMDFDIETGEFVPKEKAGTEVENIDAYCDIFHYVKGKKS